MDCKRSRNAARLACVSGVSRSVACNVFFAGDAKPFQGAVNAGFPEVNLVLDSHEFNQFTQRRIVVLSDELSERLKLLSIKFWE